MTVMNSVESTTSLQGKYCLITGGSRGLGRAICLAFAKAGASVAFTYSRHDDDAQETEALLEPFVKPIIYKGSVADATHVSATSKDLLQRWPQVDILVNNAGINQMLPLALLDEEDWDKVIAVNLKGPYLFSRAIVKGMIKNKQGSILNIGSFASERFVESPLHYAAAKSGLRGLTEALALEVGKYNVRVNLLSPGLLTEGLSIMVPQHRQKEYIQQTALGQLGNVDDVAAFACFLVSDDNTYMTGAKLVSDGGL
ncbi:3-oxoacyl-[acyl-carrier protein] reductase [hydrothermal vent metagenome]|uniref:3-oxoacyl-[acyl-carrier protein] reductase n=1 Tax=hydrothermal vent metagenome TaxID=652676 RepID=A0A3B0YM11_9ZZZZ